MNRERYEATARFFSDNRIANRLLWFIYKVLAERDIYLLPRAARRGVLRDGEPHLNGRISPLSAVPRLRW